MFAGEGSPLEPQPSAANQMFAGEGSPLEPQPSAANQMFAGEGSPLDRTIPKFIEYKHAPNNRITV